MKLISMTDFVLQEHNKFGELPYKELEKEYDYALRLIAKIRNYADFLKKPLTLGMFVPTDLDGSVLEEPKIENDRHGSFLKMQADFHIEKEYEEAKERVLFEGFEIIGNNSFTARVGNGTITYLIIDIETNDMTIEDLVNDNLELRQSVKQIGL